MITIIKDKDGQYQTQFNRYTRTYGWPEYTSDMVLEYVVTADDIREECLRRMILVTGSRDSHNLGVKISNASREAIRLMRKGEANWSAEETIRAAELEVADQVIEAIRAASNVLEESLPDDYADDSHWPSLT